MKVPKPSEADMERFRALVPVAPRVEVRPMFGNLGAFVNGNMFAGLLGSSVGVKLPDNARSELAAVDGTHPFGPEDRPMREWVALPDAWVREPELARPWLEQALAYASQLPPKPRSTKRRPTNR